MPIISTTAEVARLLAGAVQAINGIRAGFDFFKQRKIGKDEVEALLDLAEAENRDITEGELRDLLDIVQENLDELADEIEARQLSEGEVAARIAEESSQGEMTPDDIAAEFAARDNVISAEEAAATAAFNSGGPDT